MIAIYTRVSTDRQDTAAQHADLKTWIRDYAKDEEVVWYEETASGKTMDRPMWKQITAMIKTREVSTIVVWRIDRLGRTSSGLCALFDDLRQASIRLVCLSPAIDLATAGGAFVATIIAGVAQYEREIISDRIKAGIAVAKAKGKRWGGIKPGTILCMTSKDVRKLVKFKEKGMSDINIAKHFSIDTSTVWRIRKRIKDGILKL